MVPDWDKDMFSRLGIEISDYFNLMKRVAIAYNNAEDASLKHELKQKFIAMYDNATDQGIAYGSCWGISTITDIVCAVCLWLIS